jgi:tetratricopeptide (TPR) repeat protein
MVRSVGWALLPPFLAAIFVAPPAFAQGRLSTLEVKPAPSPFISPRSVTSPGWRSPAPVSPARFRVWVSAVYQHQPGEADEPSRPIWSWSQTDLASVLATLDGIRAALSSGAAVGVVHVGQWTTTVAQLHEVLALTPAETLSGDISRLLKRGAILHTDIAVAASNAERQPDFAAMLSLPSLHFGMAMELVDALRLRPGAADQDTGPASWRNAPDTPFIRAWYLATAAFLQSQYEIIGTPGFIDRGLLLFPGEPRLLLMAGGVCELLASPRVQEGHDVDRSAASIDTRDGNLRKAESFYRQALKRDAALVEARVRLGRVLGLKGQHKKALAELQAARADDADQAVRYFRLLFVGDEQAALGHEAAARQAYGDALHLYPGAQSAHLAMSSFERRFGIREAAASSIRDLLQTTAASAPDPWAEYYAAGDGRRAQQLLDGLREPFRRRR